MSVKDFMTKDLVTVTPKTKIFDAVDLMKKYDIHRLLDHYIRHNRFIQ
jgi:acetoin utilization protein AcuB